MLLRRVLSCATVSPRYSVSRAAFEFRNWSVSSATDASFVAMGLLYVVEKDRTDARMRKAPAQTHGASVPNGRTSNTCAGPRIREPWAAVPQAGTPTTGGLWLRTAYVNSAEIPNGGRPSSLAGWRAGNKSRRNLPGGPRIRM